MDFSKRVTRANSNTLNENGEALCCVCRRKKPLSDLSNCDYCGKWVCREHVKRGPLGGKICERCAK